MVAPVAASCSPTRWTVALRWLGLPLLCLLLLVAAAPAASQDGEELPPHEAAPPREAAGLSVVVSPRPDLSADLGETATVPVVVTNTGNIAALSVVVGVEDAGNQTTTSTYDDLGRLVKVTQPVVAGGAPVMTYTYDLADNLLTATGPAGDTTTMTYDKLGRKTSMNDPDMGAWSYAYDGSGNLTRQTDARNQRLCFYYDLGGRLTAKAYDGSGAAACPATAGGTSLATYTYHTTGMGKGLLSGVSGGAGAFSDDFVYDYRGRVTQQTRTINSIPFTRTTSYDAADRPLAVMYPSGEMVSYGYNGQYPKSLDSVSPTPAMTLVADLTYNQRGQLVGLSRGPTGWAVADTAYLYDNKTGNFRLKQIKHGSDSDAFPDFLYDTYDALGRLTKLTTDLGTPTETQTFGYDALGRLTDAASGGTAAPYDYHYDYSLDGNLEARVNELANPALTRDYDYADAHDHAVTTISDSMTAAYIYDANGNMTGRTESSGTYTQTFDAENRLTKVVKEAGANDLIAEFYYDADGNRLLTLYKTGTTETSRVYTPFPDFEREVAGGMVTERTTYSIAGQFIAVRVKSSSSNEVYYTYTDHLGSVAAMSWAGGTFRDGSLARYDPFGNHLTKPPGIINPGISDRGFTGHRQNNTGGYDFGLIYMNARYYMPEIGRFVSADTIVPEPENPQSFNRYTYGYNNPVKFVDPRGHNAECSVANSDGTYADDCKDWMMQAMLILGLEGGPEGRRLAILFWQWFNDPSKMLRIEAFYDSPKKMSTWQPPGNTATISMDMNVVKAFDLSDIALLGHELEHVSQGTFQAWSIQGEILAYQVEYQIREEMGVGQSDYTRGAMGHGVREPYDANYYPDLQAARDDPAFLGMSDVYDVFYEPNLPWGLEIKYRISTSDFVRSLVTNYEVRYGLREP